jgi:hypothetical protein
MLALFLEPKWKRYHPAVSKTARHMVVAGCGCHWPIINRLLLRYRGNSDSLRFVLFDTGRLVSEVLKNDSYASKFDWMVLALFSKRDWKNRASLQFWCSTWAVALVSFRIG